ncbi:MULTISPECIES: hypothetical protein [unclassified Legionella]|uniref:hypothetical protein n=1 Tax=unclassified Legionella TaxID=2622702 RepID=UPI0010550D64|nr:MULTISPECIES: hypothetical protein [unclassified Legionella]MDI9819919.1 hypothetical protein [Legionella sp. PL877]
MNHKGSFFFFFFMTCFTAWGGISDGYSNSTLAKSAKPWKILSGLRYWYSTGNITWNHNPSLIEPLLGNPASILTYSGMHGHTAEVYFRAEHNSGLFIKGYVGGGGISSGSLDDEDFLSGQIKFFNTLSSLKSGNIRYINVDFGVTLSEGTSEKSLLNNKFRIDSFWGYLYWNEKVHAFGVRCKPDDVEGIFCGPPGFIHIPFSVNGISNELEWNALRLGLTGETSISSRLKLSIEAAYLPLADMSDKDSHYLREDLEDGPNVILKGMGRGWMLEAIADYELIPHFNIGLGGRYWDLRSDGKVWFGGLNVETPLNRLRSKRYGIFAQASLQIT